MEAREVSGADRLSHLPDEILHHILSFLPETKEIVRTCVLSARFRRVWHHHPTVRLDPSITDPSIRRLDGSKPLHALAAARYLLSVHRCLLSLRSPTLQTLDLRLLSGFPFCTQSAVQWVQFASSRSVRSLRLDSYVGRNTKIPAAVYSCLALTSLELKGRIPVCPDSFTGFPFLLRLEIWGPVSTETLARLIPKCPSLRSLDLSFCASLESLDVSSETLSEVLISSCPDLHSVRLDVPNLVSVTFQGDMDALRIENARHLLDARMVTYRTAPDGLPRMIQDLRHLSRRLEVDDWLFRFPLPRSLLNPTFKNLKELHCRIFKWLTAPLLRGLVSVLWHCPKLEKLYIDLYLRDRNDILCHNQIFNYYNVRGEEYSASPGRLDGYQQKLADVREREVWDPSEEMEGFEDGRPSRLKFVVVERFLGTPNEMKMLEYLLSRESALEKLTIGDCLMRGKEEIHQLLAHIPRASQQLQILQMNMSF